MRCILYQHSIEFLLDFHQSFAHLTITHFYPLNNLLNTLSVHIYNLFVLHCFHDEVQAQLDNFHTFVWDWQLKHPFKYTTTNNVLYVYRRMPYKIRKRRHSVLYKIVCIQLETSCKVRHQWTNLQIELIRIKRNIANRIHNIFNHPFEVGRLGKRIHNRSNNWVFWEIRKEILGVFGDVTYQIDSFLFQ